MLGPQAVEPARRLGVEEQPGERLVLAVEHLQRHHSSVGTTCGKQRNSGKRRRSRRCPGAVAGSSRLAGGGEHGAGAVPADVRAGAAVVARASTTRSPGTPSSRASTTNWRPWNSPAGSRTSVTASVDASKLASAKRSFGRPNSTSFRPAASPAGRRPRPRRAGCPSPPAGRRGRGQPRGVFAGSGTGQQRLHLAGQLRRLGRVRRPPSAQERVRRDQRGGTSTFDAPRTKLQVPSLPCRSGVRCCRRGHCRPRPPPGPRRGRVAWSP